MEENSELNGSNVKSMYDHHTHLLEKSCIEAHEKGYTKGVNIVVKIINDVLTSSLSYNEQINILKLIVSSDDANRLLGLNLLKATING